MTLLRPRRRILYLFLALAAFIGLAALTGAAGEARNADAYGSRTAAELQLERRVQQSGAMRVIVRVDAGFQPEGGLGPFFAQYQRNRIAAAQDRVLARVPPEAIEGLRRFEHVPYLSMEVTGDGLSELLRSPDVVSVQQDIPEPPLLDGTVPLIGADDAWTAGYDGAGWAVAVLDTGVDTSHAAFSGKVVAEACFSTNNSDSDSLCPNGQESQTGTGAGVNCSTSIAGCDHGTHVAGIAVGSGSPQGVARGANLIAVQVFSEFTDPTCSNFGIASPCVLTWTSDQISALDWLYDQRATYNIAAANMSLGGGTTTSSACDTDSRKLSIDNLRSVNIATVIAAGNGGDRDGVSAPACISSAVSVGATDNSDDVAGFSNVADIMDLFAPGVSVNAPVPGGYGSKSGTSMAAPHAAGAWAILKHAFPSDSVDQILAGLADSGVSVTDQRSGGTVTKPRIQVDAALDALQPTPTPTPTATPEPTPVDLAPYFEAVEVVDGFSQPVFVTNAGDGSNRLFVVERAGTIRIVQDGSVLSTPFLDVRDQVATGGSEQGLLGLAFHPAYSSNGEFFIYYTDNDGAITLSRLTVSSDPDQADAASETVLLSIAKSYSNHNGGMIEFGPDGYLYVGTGDGGGAGDPDENAQDLTTLLGKILRLDVDSGTPYAIPTDNPFVGDSDPEVKGEIWAYGLRNPWRFSFDRSTGDLFIGDVGQGSREEIDFQPSSSAGGENYGWDDMEGSICYEPSSGCETSGRVLPVAEYSHTGSDHCSVTGGYRYQGSEYQTLQGVYLYADFCSGAFWSLQNVDGWHSDQFKDTSYMVSSFGEDEAGELYFLDYAGGVLYRVHIRVFADVPADQWAVDYIEALYDAGYVAGCATDPALYCPDRTLNRAEAAVFVERGINDLSFFPADPSSQVFEDVPLSSWAAKWVTVLYEDGYTAGCGTSPLIYCPWDENTRVEASVFFLHMLHGAEWTPPEPVGLFDDAPLDFWGTKWAEAAYNDGLLPACSEDPLEFCPNDSLDRSWAAYMMVQAKGGLPLGGASSASR